MLDLVLGLFTVTICRPFLAHFQFSFFFHFSKWTSEWVENEPKNDHFCKMEHTPPFCKDGHFCLHFAFILLFHFCCYFKLSSDAYVWLPTHLHHCPHWPMMLPLPPSFSWLSTTNTTPSPPVITTPTPVTKPAWATNGCKQQQPIVWALGILFCFVHFFFL